MTNATYSEYFAEAAKAVYDSLDPARQRRVEILGRMQTAYVSTPRDKQLDFAFDSLIDNVAAALFGKAAKRRAIFIVGESGSGKTTAVEKHIAKRPQFAPRITADGEEVRSLISFEAPKPLTLKGLARAGLAALNYHVAHKNITEQEIFDLWKQQLRENRVLYLWIDEMQHVLRGNTTKEIQNVADVLKSLVQIDGWPLHLILSGVPALAQFVHLAGDTDRQLKERSNLIEMRPMSYPEDAGRVRKIMLKIVTQDAELNAEDLDSDEFVHRLMHACNGAFGSTIQLVRAACEHALRLDQKKVAPLNFAVAYAYASGCRPSQNIFTAERWQDIAPDNSLGDLLARARASVEELANVGNKGKVRT
ncbi:TniB family NTP-binding protein [Sinorhizobium terangae]|uniref:TniB family NTP-binding protein n=1 Tax=Sinorhizobium terangae TaxID=110322 RepID=UPI0024B0E3E1|nr:TniB family NTP-binding protein [Sinorhizobium terangae]WFU49176.1 AAA family ATPase [Sinorhizobium terangae]